MINIFFQQFFLNSFDQQLATIFVALRSEWGIKIFTAISFLGNYQFLVPFILLITILLYIKKKNIFIFPLVLVIAGAEIITFLGKIWLYRARPLSAVFLESGFSFPSGHATAAIAFYGFLAYVLIKVLKERYKCLIIISAVLLAFLIGLSRLYLGVHYFSDVITGYLVGLVALLIGITLTKKYL